MCLATPATQKLRDLFRPLVTLAASSASSCTSLISEQDSSRSGALHGVPGTQALPYTVWIHPAPLVRAETMALNTPLSTGQA